MAHHRKMRANQFRPMPAIAVGQFDKAVHGRTWIKGHFPPFRRHAPDDFFAAAFAKGHLAGFRSIAFVRRLRAQSFGIGSLMAFFLFRR